MFPSERDTLADGPNVTHRFHKLLKRADLPPMRFHDLRHACASLLLVQGVHPRVVMETLGHSQISLTMNTYSHVLPALQRDAGGQDGSNSPSGANVGVIAPLRQYDPGAMNRSCCQAIVSRVKDGLCCFGQIDSR